MGDFKYYFYSVKCVIYTSRIEYLKNQETPNKILTQIKYIYYFLVLYKKK